MENYQINSLRSLFSFSDMMLLNMCLLASHHLSTRYGSTINYNFDLNNIVICNAIWILGAGLFKLYDKRYAYKLKNVCNATWKCILLHGTLTLSYMLLIDKSGFPLHFMLLFYGLVIASFFISRFPFITFKNVIIFFEQKPRDHTAVMLTTRFLFFLHH